MKTHPSPSHAAYQGGVGLIEVLIAVLVLSIGFLGIAALEAMSLSTNNSAYARSMATINAYSIMDAMRADLANAKAGLYNTSTPVNASSCPLPGTTLITQQLSVWCGSLAATLGANSTTTGNVNCDASGNGNCTITITFDDSRSGSKLGSNAQTFTTQGVL